MRRRRWIPSGALAVLVVASLKLACTGDDPVLATSNGVDAAVAEAATDGGSSDGGSGGDADSSGPPKPGDVDPTFVNGQLHGGASQPLPMASVHALGIDASGRVYVGGSADRCIAATSHGDFAVVRFTPAGLVDTTFGTNGRGCVDVGPSFEDDVTALSVLPSGAILIAGTSTNLFKNIGDPEAGPRAAVVRLTGAGTVDPTFSAGAPFRVNPVSDVLGWPLAFAADPAGAFYLVGLSDPAQPLDQQGSWIMRFLSDGNKDTAFNGTGFISNNLGGLYGVARDATGGAFVVGGATQLAVGRYTVSGGEVSPWGTSLIFVDPGGESQGRAAVTVGSDLFVATTANRTSGAKLVSTGVVKYLDDAGLNTTFNSGGPKPGVFLTDAVKWDRENQFNGLAVQSDGKILLAGIFDGGTATDSDLAVVRLLPSGVIDTAFGENGVARTRRAGAEKLLGMALDPSAARVVVLGLDVNGLPIAYRFLL
jgi:uncharacterized delta-60 repeat protein